MANETDKNLTWSLKQAKKLYESCMNQGTIEAFFSKLKKKSQLFFKSCLIIQMLTMI